MEELTDTRRKISTAVGFDVLVLDNIRQCVFTEIKEVSGVTGSSLIGHQSHVTYGDIYGRFRYFNGKCWLPFSSQENITGWIFDEGIIVKDQFIVFVKGEEMFVIETNKKVSPAAKDVNQTIQDHQPSAPAQDVSPAVDQPSPAVAKDEMVKGSTSDIIRVYYRPNIIKTGTFAVLEVGKEFKIFQTPPDVNDCSKILVTHIDKNAVIVSNYLGPFSFNNKYTVHVKPDGSILIPFSVTFSNIERKEHSKNEAQNIIDYLHTKYYSLITDKNVFSYRSQTSKSEDGSCIGCLSCQPNIMFMECFHVCLCNDCFTGLKNKTICPICSNESFGVQIFFA